MCDSATIKADHKSQCGARTLIYHALLCPHSTKNRRNHCFTGVPAFVLQTFSTMKFQCPMLIFSSQETGNVNVSHLSSMAG